MTKTMSTDRLAAKVAWEGGIIPTLDYGIRSESIEDPEVAEQWSRLEDLYDQMLPVIATLDLRMRRERAA